MSTFQWCIYDARSDSSGSGYMLVCIHMIILFIAWLGDRKGTCVLKVLLHQSLVTAWVPGQSREHGLVRQCDRVMCRSPVDGEDNVAGLCCHLEEQVRALHTRVCEALQRKYSSILRCDDHTAQLSNDVIVQFALVKPVFEHLEKVRL